MYACWFANTGASWVKPETGPQYTEGRETKEGGRSLQTGGGQV